MLTTITTTPTAPNERGKAYWVFVSLTKNRCYIHLDNNDLYSPTKLIIGACINGLYQNVTIIIQLKYTIELVSEVPVHQE